MKPPKMLASTTTKPYARPNPTAKVCALLAESGLLPDVGELPNPVYTADPPEVWAGEPSVDEAAAAVEVAAEVLYRFGSWAPQG